MSLGWSALSSRALQRVFGLDAPDTRSLSVRRDVAVAMDDGVVLLADHYAPRPLRLGTSAAPVVLVRSPYGRRGTFALLYGRVLAERGFQVFIQSCRGTAGSGGEFVPQINEQRDGIATVRWLRSQPWCDGRIASAGMSYLGYTQYATATHPDADIAALALQVTMADLGETIFGTGAMSLANSLGWARMMSLQSSAKGRFRSLTRRSELSRAFASIPLADSDKRAIGHTIGWYQDWLANPSPELPYWRRQSHRDAVPGITAPMSMLTGWYDLFLPWMLRDYEALAAAGNAPELTIGPWRHAAVGHGRAIPGTTVRFLQHRVLGRRAATAQPAVRIYVTGADPGWRDLPSWPPPASPQSRHLAAAQLRDEPATDGSTTFRYDPADPTPSLGGPMLQGKDAVVDNADHEQRLDVVTFTSEPLTTTLEFVGTPIVELRLSADNLHHDVFVRLCEVDAEGHSWNVCDRLRRLDQVALDADGTRTVRIALWPAAHRIATGRRLRLQVSAGAHPRYARNLGSGEPLAASTSLRPTTVTVHHAGSRLTLPVQASVDALPVYSSTSESSSGSSASSASVSAGPPFARLRRNFSASN